MANTRSNVYKPTARKSLRQNSPRVLLSNVYRLVRIDIPFPGQPVQLQFALTDCSLPFKFLNVSLFFLFSRDSSRLTSAISTTNSSYEIYIVEITVSCDTLIELATLSNLYFSTLSSILHVHTIVYYPLPLIAR